MTAGRLALEDRAGLARERVGRDRIAALPNGKQFSG
jgi:hypothetical protein